MIRVHVHGARGRMGEASVTAITGAQDMELTGSTGRGDDLRSALPGVDVLVDFTMAEAAVDAIRLGIAAGCHVVSGTTGISDEQRRELGEQADRGSVGLLIAPNFALGVLLMQRFAKQAARVFPDVEILELHHDAKRDAPSGTALHTAALMGIARSVESEEIRPEARGVEAHGVPIHSVRLPGLLAHQEVIFGGPGQVLTLRHDTLDRQAFMPGVLLGIRRIRERTGLVDTLDTLLTDEI